jgi:hypothetical protein
MQITQTQLKPLGYAHLGVDARALGLRPDQWPEQLELIGGREPTLFTRWRGTRYGQDLGGVEYRTADGTTLTLFHGTPITPA